MDCVEKYVSQEKEIFKKKDANLLSDLLYLNHQFMNTYCYEKNENLIFGDMHDDITYSKEDIEEIITNGIKIFENKHNLFIKYFNNLTYEEKINFSFFVLSLVGNNPIISRSFLFII